MADQHAHWIFPVLAAWGAGVATAVGGFLVRLFGKQSVQEQRINSLESRMKTHDKAERDDGERLTRVEEKLGALDKTVSEMKTDLRGLPARVAAELKQ